jgi:hypothetical protein
MSLGQEAAGSGDRDRGESERLSDIANPARMTSRPRDFHPRALPEPYVNLSIHTAPDVRPLPWHSGQWAKSVGFARNLNGSRDYKSIVNNFSAIGRIGLKSASTCDSAMQSDICWWQSLVINARAMGCLRTFS